MASAKDTFESHTFRANTFASGTWRGVGVAGVSGPFFVAAADIFVPGIGAGQLYAPGSQAAEVYQPYSVGQVN